MLHSTMRLSRMSAGMLQLSSEQRTKNRADLRKGDLRDCVEQALHEITPFAEEKAARHHGRSGLGRRSALFRLQTDGATPAQPAGQCL